MVDAATVRLARAGAREARDAIAREFRERILRYATTMIGDTEAAGDIAQETFSRAFDRLTDLRDDEKIGSWIYSIAINLCRAHLRQLVDAPAREPVGDPAAPRQSVLSSVVRRESAEAVAIAIDRLPILLREAFVLRVVEGLPYAEIARITEATEATLQVRAHRAKALLKRQLGAVVDTFWSE